MKSWTWRGKGFTLIELLIVIAIILILVVATLPLTVQGCLALLPQVRTLLPGGIGTTRALAAAFLFCDLAISAALLSLLVLGDPSAVPLEDRRSPIGDRRLWRLLLGLVILSYAGLSPFFLFLYLRLR